MLIVDGKCQCMPGYVIDMDNLSCISVSECENKPDALVSTELDRCVCNSDSKYDGKECVLLNPSNNTNNGEQHDDSPISNNIMGLADKIVLIVFGVFILVTISTVLGILMYRHLKEKRARNELYDNVCAIVDE